MSHRHEKDKGVNVQVLLRCRPFSEGELRANTPQVVTCADFQREVSVTTSVHGKHTERVFTFDKVFGPTTRQRDLYNEAVVPIVNEVLEGFNCTIFAYGQTGTGKTFTMEGECRMSKSGPKGELPQNAGVVPRAVQQIFDTLESQNAEYSVKVTFLELYNEEITDLLAPEEISRVSAEEKQRKPLPLMEDGKGGVLVRGLEEEIVTSANEIFTLLERGSAKRRTAETMLNKQSSRSHSLFSITIHIKEATPEGEELIKCGKLNLVDLAGSENVTRAGAGQGRAREAGEINKSLLTLGRVINALLEHQGHIPYRDSKLTRLLRDSLGGRTKTCIIATVAPSVHCLEETLSTLDYAHRAKNIKNKPEVNQKMTKQTLIKDLYSEIDRLKAEVYATREKVGVYLPKERYEQDENERKAMAERIEQMTAGDETNRKRIEELEKLYGAGCKKLEACEKTLEETGKLLAAAREDLTRSQYSLKEKEFVICELKMAENALTKQAYELQAKLEKSVQENHLLFSKIAREDRLSMANKTIVNNFQGDLVEKISSLCGIVVSSMNQQKQQLLQIEGMGKSFIDYHDKSLSELKKRVYAAQVQYVSHLDEFQNDVRLQKADINGTLDEISLMSCANHKSLDHVLAVGDGLAAQIIKDLKDTLSSQKEEAARFAQDIRERFYRSIEDTKCMSNSLSELLEKIADETSKLRQHANVAHDILTQEISDIRTNLREKRRLESEQLLFKFHKQFLSLQSQHQDMLDEELLSVMEKVTKNKVLVDASTSSTGVIANDTKRKWETFAVNAETLYNEGAESISAKHSRMSLFYQQCAASVDTSLKHWKDTNKSVKEMATKHLAGVDVLVRTIVDANEEHDRKIAKSRIVAEKDVAIGCDDIALQFEGVVEHEHETVSRMMDTLNSQALTLHNLNETHTACTSDILKHAENTFRDSYEDYEPTGETPVRSEPEVPSKCTIESLRAMPMDALEEGFRENNPYVSTKEPKPSLIPRSPLIPRN